MQTRTGYMAVDQVATSIDRQALAALHRLRNPRFALASGPLPRSLVAHSLFLFPLSIVAHSLFLFPFWFPVSALAPH